MSRFEFLNIDIYERFVDYFAKQYISQRSDIDQTLLAKAESLNCGMNIQGLMDVIKKHSTFIDPSRENEQQPHFLKDIYRSDLGELLTTFYFETKLPKGEAFIIPLKNLSTRERYDMPGKGIDAIGYRIEDDGVINLLLSEAKVSEEKKNPPSVVDKKEDSIYKTQKKHHDNPAIVIQRLTEYVRHLSSTDYLIPMGCLLVMMENGSTDKYKITYGCGLVRDYTCSSNPEDFGKMKSNENEFAPGSVHFAIFSFNNKTIEETVQLFYNKVRELTK